MLLLLIKITLSLFFTMTTGIFLGNFFWNYNLEIMPWWFKLTLALVALLFYASLGATIYTAIWSIPG